MISFSDWKKYRLDEVAIIQGGGTPRRSEALYFGGSIPWVTPTDLPAIGLVTELNGTKDTISEIGLKNSSAKLITAGSVLYSSRASVGKIAVTNTPCATNQGFTNFTPNRKIVDPWFLAYLLCRYTNEIVNLAGKTTFLEVPKKKFKSFEVAIPPVVEQRRILRIIQGCFIRLSELGEQYKCRSNDLLSLKRSLVFGTSNGRREWLRVSEVVDWIEKKESVQQDSIYKFAGARSFGKGLFHSSIRKGSDFKYTSIYRLRYKDFTYPKLMAWEGAFGMVTKELDGYVVSPEFVVFRPKDGKICTEVLDTYFRSPYCIPDIQKASTGSNRRRRRLNPKAFLNLKIPIPSQRKQEHLKAVYEFEQRGRRDWFSPENDIDFLRKSILRKAFAGEL